MTSSPLSIVLLSFLNRAAFTPHHAAFLLTETIAIEPFPLRDVTRLER